MGYTPTSNASLRDNACLINLYDDVHNFNEFIFLWLYHTKNHLKNFFALRRWKKDILIYYID